MGYYRLMGSSTVNWREVSRFTIERANRGSNRLWFPVLTAERKYQRRWRCGLPKTGPLLTLADWLRGVTLRSSWRTPGATRLSLLEIEGHM
jgi:hypothetical protein